MSVRKKKTFHNYLVTLLIKIFTDQWYKLIQWSYEYQITFKQHIFKVSRKCYVFRETQLSFVMCEYEEYSMYDAYKRRVYDNNVTLSICAIYTEWQHYLHATPKHLPFISFHGQYWLRGDTYHKLVRWDYHISCRDI